jgi:predicted Rossmann fold nucleotide-binding protein DprA/Smf involved in DNA uptake
MRNRIISGLSRTTVVVEAGLGSGSLITAKDAISQGKTVFAIPANVGSPGAEGSNGLLRDGARVAVCAEDILEPFEYAYQKHLRCERLVGEGDGEALADYRYLASLGVIELTQSHEDSGRQTPQIPQQAKRMPARQAEKAKRQDTVPERAPAPPKEGGQATHQTNQQTPEEILSALSATQLAVFEAMPDDRAVSMDVLSGLDYPYGEIIAALTKLEIMGLIQKLPGALYTKS